MNKRPACFTKYTDGCPACALCIEEDACWTEYQEIVSVKPTETKP